MTTITDLLAVESLSYADWRQHDELDELGRTDDGRVVLVVTLADHDLGSTTQVLEQVESQGEYEAPIYHYTPLRHGPITRGWDEYLRGRGKAA